MRLIVSNKRPTAFTVQQMPMKMAHSQDEKNGSGRGKGGIWSWRRTSCADGGREKIINGGAKFFANTFSRLINFGSAVAAFPPTAILFVLFYYPPFFNGKVLSLTVSGLLPGIMHTSPDMRKVLRRPLAMAMLELVAPNALGKLHPPWTPSGAPLESSPSSLF